MKDILEPLDRRKRRRTDLANSLRAYAEKSDSLQRAIAEHRNFDPHQAVDQLSQLHLTKDRVAVSLASARISVRDLTGRKTTLEANAVSIFNVFSYFSTDQDALRSEIKALIAPINSALSDVKRFEKQQSSTIAEIEHASSELKTYREFDESAAKDNLGQILTSVNTISDEIRLLDQEITSINQKVGPLVTEYNRISEKVRSLQARISQAAQLDRDLSSASNGYARRQLHDECERKFGQGRPATVRNDAQRELRGIENNLPKLERRIKEQLKKFEMIVSHVIIDGNNTCYNGSNFIRLHALTHLVDELSKKYKVTVIFDASIRNLMKKNDADIASIIGHAAKIHVTPTKTGADEYILRLADGRPDTYVISNDRFGEYRDYDAVASGRLLRFLIAGNQIMLNDLDIAIPFSP